jgi:hypothetical protein
MDIISLLTNPINMLMIVLMLAIAYFTYYTWRQTSSSIEQLEVKHQTLHKQLTHGVITDSHLRPLRSENASNMSDDTMDYEYSESGTETETDAESEEAGSDSEPEPEENTAPQVPVHSHSPKLSLHGKLNELVQQHQHHQAAPPQQTSVYRTAISQPKMIPSPLSRQHIVKPNIIPDRDMINDLRQLKNNEEEVLLDDSDSNSTAEYDGELIEFHDIDDNAPSNANTSIVSQRINDKINLDVQRIDQENYAYDKKTKLSVPTVAVPVHISVSPVASKPIIITKTRPLPTPVKVVAKPTLTATAQAALTRQSVLKTVPITPKTVSVKAKVPIKVKTTLNTQIKKNR